MEEKFDRDCDELFIGIAQLMNRVTPSSAAAMHVLIHTILKVINDHVEDKYKHQALVEMYVFMKDQLKMDERKHETQIRTLRK